jgi:hypothetical protein
MTSIIQFWYPNEGWVVVRQCSGCKENALKHKPQPPDNAWNKCGERCEMSAKEATTPFIFRLPENDKGKIGFFFSSLLRGIIGLP